MGDKGAHSGRLVGYKMDGLQGGKSPTKTQVQPSISASPASDSPGSPPGPAPGLQLPNFHCAFSGCLGQAGGSGVDEEGAESWGPGAKQGGPKARPRDGAQELRVPGAVVPPRPRSPPPRLCPGKTLGRPAWPAVPAQVAGARPPSATPAPPHWAPPRPARDATPCLRARARRSSSGGRQGRCTPFLGPLPPRAAVRPCASRRRALLRGGWVGKTDGAAGQVGCTRGRILVALFIPYPEFFFWGGGGGSTPCSA